MEIAGLCLPLKPQKERRLAICQLIKNYFSYDMIGIQTVRGKHNDKFNY